jgi:hypothetical protein
MSLKNKMNLKTAIAATVLAAGMSYGVDVTVGGNIQIVNLLNVNPQLGLDFTSDGDAIPIAYFTISNNTTSFDLELSFANGGEFLRSGQADGAGILLEGVYIGPEGSGTLGAGALVNELDPTVAANPGVTFGNADDGGDLSAVVDGGAGPIAVTWDPLDQTSSTTGYTLELTGDWTASTQLAGLYTEVITATLVATP